MKVWTVKFSETRLIDTKKLRNLCVENEWYTRGDCDAYANMFETAERYTGEVSILHDIADDIFAHSNLNCFDECEGWDATVLGILAQIMGMISNKCIITRYSFEQVEEEV